jgi:hypothetical protein
MLRALHVNSRELYLVLPCTESASDLPDGPVEIRGQRDEFAVLNVAAESVPSSNVILHRDGVVPTIFVSCHILLVSLLGYRLTAVVEFVVVCGEAIFEAEIGF